MSPGRAAYLARKKLATQRADANRPKVSRRQLLMDMGYSVFRKVRARIAADCNFVCVYCGAAVTTGAYGGDQLATIDHKTPLSRGGTWKRYNLTCACRRCNNDKADMTAEDFMDWRRGIGRMPAAAEMKG